MADKKLKELRIKAQYCAEEEFAYKGFGCCIDLDEEDGAYWGRLSGIKDVVGFHADSLEALKEKFHEAVDDYLATLERMGREPNWLEPK